MSTLDLARGFLATREIPIPPASYQGGKEQLVLLKISADGDAQRHFVFMPIGASNTLHCSFVLFPPCVERSLDAANTSVRATGSARTLACRLDTRVETLRINGLQCIRKLSDIAHSCRRPAAVFARAERNVSILQTT